MDLRTFYQQQSAEEREAFAAAIGTSPLYYRNVAYEFRNANDTLALAIERETRGKVTVAELRPKLAEALAANGYHKRKRKTA
jgi:DNA-binding transcriptional regulator YdaS (Cro superfamily)